MPQFGLKGIKAAKYVNTAGTITYTNPTEVGDAMTANLELRFAEGRLYAEDMLAEYMRKAIGGTISIGVKYIKQTAQQLLFGVQTKNRSVTYTPTGTTVTATATATSVVTGGSDLGQYVGLAFYSPDMSLQTMGENIAFNTPTTSGEFLADDSAAQDLFEVAIVDDENAAKAWITAVLA